MRSPDAHDRQLLTVDKRKAAIALLVAMVLAGAAFTVLGETTTVGSVGPVVAHSDKGLLALSVAGQLLAYLGYTLAYRSAARASGGPCFDYVTAAEVVIFGAGTAVLGASVGGLAVDFWALRRSGLQPRVAARRILAVGTLEWTILSMYALGAALLTLIVGANAPLAMILGWLVAIPVCVAAAIWFSAPTRVQALMAPRFEASGPPRSRPQRVCLWLARKLHRGLTDAIAGVVLVRHLLAHPARYSGAAIGYPLYWAGDMLTLYGAISAFGVPPDPVSMVLAYATGFVVSSLPLPAGGAGGVEATIALSLHSTGVAWTAAVLGVFLYRLLTFWLPIVPALALLPSLRRLAERLASAPHTERDRDASVTLRKAMS